MKLAVSSHAFDRAIAAGDLTQLEFLDWCARDRLCDGVVLDARHFPRSDDDYLAQLKKVATDRGLTVAALADEAFFSADEPAMRAALARAVAIGAPLLAAPLALETSSAWVAQLERLNVATGLAKHANVTLALRNRPGTFAATDADCRRATKEADSAWLRYGIEPEAFDRASEPARLAANTVLVWARIAADARERIATTLAAFQDFDGFVVLDGEDVRPSDLRASLRAWYDAIARRALDRT